jgi:RNA polymerase sigma-70 factor (ECF subfamily)
MERPDEELVAAFQGGDYSAFDVLVRRWERKMQGAAFRLLGSEEDARDVSQEAFLKAFRALDRFRGQAKFSSWLYQIVLNLCRDRARRRRGRSWVSWDELSEEGGALPSQDDGWQRLETRDLSRRVASAMAALPEDQREVIVLKEYEGLTFPEIAELLDVPLSTVKTRLYRGLTQLRKRLELQGIRPAVTAAVTPL